jgi:hypothetical protein
MPDAATWAAIVGPITTLLGGLGGYWLAGRNDEARDQQAAAREAAARRDVLAGRLEEQRHTLQRDTLLELQDELQDELQRLARITTRIALQDQKTLKERGQLYLLPEGLSEEARQIVTSVQRLRTRPLRNIGTKSHGKAGVARLLPVFGCRGGVHPNRTSGVFPSYRPIWVGCHID